MSGKRIMVVEDESVVALDIQETLRRLGYDVPQPVSSAEKAMFIVAEVDPDLVIMDIKLEGEISGLEAAQQIYQKYHIPIIFLTAYGDQDILSKAREVHPFGYVLKPFTDQQLEIAIQMALHHHTVEEQLKKNERRLKRSQRMAHLGDWEWDRDSQQVTLSEELADMLGFGRDERVHDVSAITGLIHPQDRKGVLAQMENIQENISRQEKGVFRIRRPDGMERWLEASPPSVERMNAQGEPVVLVGTLYDVTQRMSFEEQRRQRDEYLSTVHKITRAALESSTIQEILHTLTQSLGDLFDARSCYLISWDESRKLAVPISAYGENQDVYLNLHFQKEESSITERVLQEEEPLLIENIRKSEHLSGRKKRQYPRGCYLFVPLISGNKKLGAACLVFDRQRAVSDEMIQRAQEISRQVALAIAKTELLQEAKQRWRETEILRQAGMALIKSRSLEAALDVFLDYVKELVEFDSAAVFLARGEEFYVAQSLGLPAPEDVMDRYFPREERLFQDILNGETSIVKEDVQQETAFTGWGGTTYTRSWMGVPLVSKGEVIGVLTLDHHLPGVYRERQAHVIEVLANQAATAIQKVRLAKSEKDQLYITRTLQEISSLLASGVELEDVLSSILQLLKRVVDYDQAYIAFVENGDELHLAAGRGPTDQEAIQAFYDRHAGTIINELSARKSRPIVHSDVRDVPGWIPFERGIDIRSTINAPLLFRGELVGVLFVDSTRPNAYTEEMGETVMTFANQAALAINNARLFERNQQLAITDELTGVYNRRYLMNFGEKEVKRAVRFGEPLALLMFDLDDFKDVNDTFGHVIGDDILQQVARRCQNAVREIDIIARYGGDEFVVILLKADLGVAREVAQRLQEVVEKPIDTEKGSMKLTLSIGITALAGEDTTLEELLLQVDEALYAAKNAGRACIKAHAG